MNQNQTKKTLSVKMLLLSVLLSFVMLGILAFVGAFVLKNVNHHERFYGYVSWVVTALLSLWVAFLSKKNTGNSVLFSLIVSLLFSVICVAVGCIIGSENMSFIPLLIRFILFVIASVGFTVMFNYFAANRSRAAHRKPVLKKR